MQLCPSLGYDRVLPCPTAFRLQEDLDGIPVCYIECGRECLNHLCDVFECEMYFTRMATEAVIRCRTTPQSFQFMGFANTATDNCQGKFKVEGGSSSHDS